jgi:hypothetical protein
MDMETINTVHKSNKHIFLLSQAVKSASKCTTILVAGPSLMFEDYHNINYFNITQNNIKTPIKRIEYLRDKT